MSTSNISKFELLKQVVEQTSISYEKVVFPAIHEGDGIFRFANGFRGKFDVLGAGYLSERVPKSYAYFTKRAREERWDEIEGTLKEHAHLLKGDYVAALYQGKIVGIMANYNPVPHKDLLEKIEAAGLADDVHSFGMSPMELTVNLRVKSLNNSDALIGIRIVNGHSGHSALRCFSIVMIDTYEWSDRVKHTSRRHLSKVGEVVSAIEQAFEVAADLKLDDRLAAMSFEEGLSVAISANPNLSIRQERLLQVVRDSKPANALEFVCLLGSYSSTKGYKSSVQKLIDPIIERALGRS